MKIAFRVYSSAIWLILFGLLAAGNSSAQVTTLKPSPTPKTAPVVTPQNDTSGVFEVRLPRFEIRGHQSERPEAMRS